MPQNRKVGLDETARGYEQCDRLRCYWGDGQGEGIGKGQKSVPASPVDLPSGLG